MHFRIYLIHNTLQEQEFYSEQTQSLVGVNCEFSPGKLPFTPGKLQVFSAKNKNVNKIDLYSDNWN